MVSSGNRALSPWWHFYQIKRDQASVQELDADKLFACCNLCGRNIAAGNKAGKGGIKRYIKGQHPGQLKFMDAKHGGTLGVDIASTIKKERPEMGTWQLCGLTQVFQWLKERKGSLSLHHSFWQWLMFLLMLLNPNILKPC
jgi:hypothetical protein